jgi:hypothetical protein
MSPGGRRSAGASFSCRRKKCHPTRKVEVTLSLGLSDRMPSGCVVGFPEQFAKLRTDPGLARAAIEEAVRYGIPVQTFFRTMTGPGEIISERWAKSSRNAGRLHSGIAEWLGIGTWVNWGK